MAAILSMRASSIPTPSATTPTRGLWQQRTLKFDAALLKPGVNQMTFTVPAGDLQSGVVWDYLRLELARVPKFASATPATASP